MTSGWKNSDSVTFECKNVWLFDLRGVPFCSPNMDPWGNFWTVCQYNMSTDRYKILHLHYALACWTKTSLQWTLPSPMVDVNDSHVKFGNCTKRVHIIIVPIEKLTGVIVRQENLSWMWRFPDFPYLRIGPHSFLGKQETMQLYSPFQSSKELQKL